MSVLVLPATVADAVSGRIGGYGHGYGSGMSEVLRTIAHAAIWSTVGRLMWSAPWVVVLVAAAVAAGYLLMKRRRSS
jgi:hypothetical protein